MADHHSHRRSSGSSHGNKLGHHQHHPEHNRQSLESRLPRPSTPPTAPPPSSLLRSHTLSFGVVCSSNINRSMEAHLVFSNAGLNVESYGTGTTVRLPGRSAMEPRIFKFGTPYRHMYESLSATEEDEVYFQRIGVLQLCKRGAAVKQAPQRWQDTPTEVISGHDIVVAFEERIFDAVVQDLQSREPTETFAPIHIICLDTKDNPQEAKIQGRVALELCWMLEMVAEGLVKDRNKKNGEEDDDVGGDDDEDEGGMGGALVVEMPLLLEQFEEERMKHTDTKLLYQLCYL